MKPASDRFVPGLIYCRRERPSAPTGACGPAFPFTFRRAIVYSGIVAPLAQWLEQRPFKSWVVGSSPTGGTGWPCGTVAFCTVFSCRTRFSRVRRSCSHRLKLVFQPGCSASLPSGCRDLQLFHAPRKAVADGTGVSIDELALPMGGTDPPQRHRPVGRPPRCARRAMDSTIPCSRSFVSIRPLLLFDP